MPNMLLLFFLGGFSQAQGGEIQSISALLGALVLHCFFWSKSRRRKNWGQLLLNAREWHWGWDSQYRELNNGEAFSRKLRFQGLFQCLSHTFWGRGRKSGKAMKSNCGGNFLVRCLKESSRTGMLLKDQEYQAGRQKFALTACTWVFWSFVRSGFWSEIRSLLLWQKTLGDWWPAAQLQEMWFADAPLISTPFFHLHQMKHICALLHFILREDKTLTWRILYWWKTHVLRVRY